MTIGRAENKDRDSDEDGADQQPGTSLHVVLSYSDIRLVQGYTQE